MIRKLFVVMLIAGAAVFSTACWEDALLGYTCSGLGTCSSPKTCCAGYDCYYVANGETFDCYYTDCASAAQALSDYCYYGY